MTTSLSNSTHTLTDSIYERFYTCGVGLLRFRELWERARVGKTRSYDSAKGWDFTQSPCVSFPATFS